MQRSNSFIPLTVFTTIVAVGGCTSPTDDEEPQVVMTANGALQTCRKLEWGMHWKDEFENGTTLDTSRWNPWDRVVNEADTVQKPGLVRIHDGVLRLAARNEEGCAGFPWTGAGPVQCRPYTGAGLHTYGKFWTGKYFKAEVRAKVSQEKGLFGAPLWFRPTKELGPTENIGGEIDVVEVLGKDKTPRFHMTLHPDYADTTGKPVHVAKKFEDVGDKAGTEFHDYTVEKVPNGITIWVDGKHAGGWGCGSRANDPLPPYYEAAFEVPTAWTVRIDNKVGGNWAGPPNGNTDWGLAAALKIKYIKVWRPKP
jgi:beta-glucanase (GH16 family)